MSCGCAILSTRHAGIPEAVEEGVNGLLVDEHDVESYRGALSRLTNREVNLEQMMARSRERAVVQFDNGKLLAQTEDIIRELVKKGAPSRRVPLRCP
jgi:glycosyltransferase involved in cell wall biosynthesis